MLGNVIDTVYMHGEKNICIDTTFSKSIQRMELLKIFQALFSCVCRSGGIPVGFVICVITVL